MLLAGMAIAEVPSKESLLYTAQLFPAALRLIVVPIIVLLLLRVFHASDWIADGKSNFNDSLSIGYYAVLCDSHLNGATLQS